MLLGLSVHEYAIRGTEKHKVLGCEPSMLRPSALSTIHHLKKLVVGQVFGRLHIVLNRKVPDPFPQRMRIAAHVRYRWKYKLRLRVLVPVPPLNCQKKRGQDGLFKICHFRTIIPWTEQAANIKPFCIFFGRVFIRFDRGDFKVAKVSETHGRAAALTSEEAQQ